METMIKQLKNVELENPILIEGLPGIGMVGKLCVDQLIDQLEAEKFAEIHSFHFQPKVDIQEDSVVTLRKNYLYAYKTEEGKSDLVFLAGQEQGITPQGQYELSKAVIDEMKNYGPSFIYTLGGYKAGELKDSPKVFGAVTHKEIKEDYGEEVSFNKGGAIAGAAGLLLGLGEKEGMKGICLMGETHGQVLDPNAAKFILKILEVKLDVEVDYSELEEKTDEVKDAIEQMKKAQKTQSNTQVSGMNPSEKPQDYIQ